MTFRTLSMSLSLVVSIVPPVPGLPGLDQLQSEVEMIMSYAKTWIEEQEGWQSKRMCTMWDFRLFLRVA
jgi:hypothetical protein